MSLSSLLLATVAGRAAARASGGLVAARRFRSDRKRAIEPRYGRPTRRTAGFVAAAGYCDRAGGTVVPFVLADIGEGISEVTVKEWYVNVGDRVAEFDDVCEVESDKATVTITSRYTGVVTKLHHETGCLARVGSVLVDIELDAGGDGGTAAAQTPPPSPEPSAEATRTASSGRAKVLTSPAVRRMAAETGVDLATVRGTGKHGRVLKEDLLLPPDPVDRTRSSVPPLPPPPPPPQDFIPLTGYAKNMRTTMEASNQIPALVLTDEVDLTRLLALKADLSAANVRLTLFPFLVKATSLALARHPRLNSTGGPGMTSYRYNDRHNIGVAVDTPLGLVVPNVKDVQTLGVVDVARRIAELRVKAEAGKLAPVDVTGGTFTLSNLGSIAGSVLRPMILPPEMAIGALGRMRYQPRYDSSGQLVRTPVMYVSWAADHRILDGASVARFFNDWKTYVENPLLIMAGVDLQPTANPPSVKSA